MKNKKVVLLLLSLFLAGEVIFYLGYNAEDLQGKFSLNNDKTKQHNVGEVSAVTEMVATVVLSGDSDEIVTTFDTEILTVPDTYTVTKVESYKNAAEEASVVAEESYYLAVDYYNSNQTSLYASASNDVYDAVADAEQAVATAETWYDRIVSNYDSAKESYEDAGDILASEEASLDLINDNLDAATKASEEADAAYEDAAVAYEEADAAFYNAYDYYEELDNGDLTDCFDDDWNSTCGRCYYYTSSDGPAAIGSGDDTCQDLLGSLLFTQNEWVEAVGIMTDALYLTVEYEIDIYLAEQQIIELEAEYESLKDAYEEKSFDYSWGTRYYDAAVGFLEVAQSYQDMLSEL